jgi:hypothetical protein
VSGGVRLHAGVFARLLLSGGGQECSACLLRRQSAARRCPVQLPPFLFKRERATKPSRRCPEVSGCMQACLRACCYPVAGRSAPHVCCDAKVPPGGVRFSGLHFFLKLQIFWILDSALCFYKVFQYKIASCLQTHIFWILDSERCGCSAVRPCLNVSKVDRV